MSSDTLGPYRVMGRVGEGGMSVVHLGLDPEGRPVAVKVLKPHIAADAEGRLRFAREVRALRRVRGRHVAEVLDAAVEADRPYVVMRYVPGRSLLTLVRERGPLAEPALAALGVGLADALCGIHAAGIVHRDLKPGNVLIEDGVPTVIDFGIARLADETMVTSTGLLVGTPGYLAPEIVLGREVTCAADVHAWGATLAYAGTGRAPFGSGSVETVLWNVTQGNAILDGLPPRLRPLVEEALRRDPHDRPRPEDLLRRCVQATDNDRPAARGGQPGQPIQSAQPVQPVQPGQPVVVFGAEATVQLPRVPPPSVEPDAVTTTLGRHARPTQAAATTVLHPAEPATARLSSPGSPTSGSALPTAAATPGAPAAATRTLPTSPLPGSGRAAPGRAGAADRQRPGDRARPRGRGVVVAATAAVASAAVLAPLVVAIVLVGVLCLLRVVDTAASGLAYRRSQRGPRRSDGVQVALALPWHAALAVALTVWHLPVPALGALVVGAAAGLLVEGPAPGTGSAGAIATTTAAFVLLSWAGRRGAAPRRASSWLLGRGLPSRAATAIVVCCLLVAAGGALAVAASGAERLWWPLDLAWLPIGLVEGTMSLLDALESQVAPPLP